MAAAIAPAARRPSRDVYWETLKGVRETPVFDGAALLCGNALDGPAVIETTDTTVIVPPGRRLRVDAFGNFEIALG